MLTGIVSRPEVVRIPAREAAVIRLKIPRAEIRNAMKSGMQELHAALAQQSVDAVGPVFSHHLRLDPQRFEFEVGTSVDRAVEPAGRVEPVKFPEMKVVRSAYTGPYTGLAKAWAEFDSMLTRAGHEVHGELWEAYVDGPAPGRLPDEYYTELYRPLV